MKPFKRKSDDFLDINSSQMWMKYKSFPESEVSWEQKGKYEKVPKYEAQVCFGTAGLEALDEETPTPCRFMWMMFVWPEFREMSRIGSRFEVCMSSRWRRMKERLEVYGQWQLLGSTSRNRWNSLFVFCFFSENDTWESKLQESLGKRKKEGKSVAISEASKSTAWPFFSPVWGGDCTSIGLSQWQSLATSCAHWRHQVVEKEYFGHPSQGGSVKRY